MTFCDIEHPVEMQKESIEIKHRECPFPREGRDDLRAIDWHAQPQKQAQDLVLMADTIREVGGYGGGRTKMQRHREQKGD